MGAIALDCVDHHLLVFGAEEDVFGFVDGHVLGDLVVGGELVEGLLGDGPPEDELRDEGATILLGMPVEPPPPPET